MKRFLMFFIVFMGLVSFSSAEIVANELYSQGSITSANGSYNFNSIFIGNYTVQDVLNILNGYANGDELYTDSYNEIISLLENDGYTVQAWKFYQSDSYQIILYYWLDNVLDMGIRVYYNSSGVAFFDSYFLNSGTETVKIQSIRSGNNGNNGFNIPADSNVHKSYALNGYANYELIYSPLDVKSLELSTNYIVWDGESYFYKAETIPEGPDYSSDLAGLITAITTSDVIKDNKIHGRDEFFIIPYGSVLGKNLYDIYFYGDYLSLSAFEYLSNDGNLYYDLNKTIDNGLANLIANIWGEEKVKGSYFSALYDTETGNIDISYNGSFLFSSYEMQGFSSVNNPIIYTTKDIPYYYYEKDEATGEWIATADENKNIVNKVITDSDGNEISNEIVGSTESVSDTLWSRFVAVIKSVPESILAGIKKLFIPDLSYLEGTMENLKTKLGFITQARDIVEDITNGIELNPTAPPSIKIDLTNANSKYNWGTEALCIDLSWYAPFKPAVDFLIICFCYGYFFWNLFRKLPDIINGVAGDVPNMSYQAERVSNNSKRERIGFRTK